MLTDVVNSVTERMGQDDSVIELCVREHKPGWAVLHTCVSPTQLLPMGRAFYHGRAFRRLRSLQFRVVASEQLFSIRTG